MSVQCFYLFCDLISLRCHSERKLSDHGYDVAHCVGNLTLLGAFSCSILDYGNRFLSRFKEASSTFSRDLRPKACEQNSATESRR